MKNKLCILVCLMLFAGMAKAEKEVIRIATDQVDLIYRVGENGRLYQAYLGQRLKYDTDIPHLPNIGEAYLTHGMEDYFEPAVRIFRKFNQ